MAVILENRPLSEDIFRLTLSGVAGGQAGQFVQVHLPDGALLLPRPISLFDADGDTVTLVYRIVGRGTKLLSGLRDGPLRVTGPLGSGFPIFGGPAVLIGGGLGIAPLHLLAKTLRAKDPSADIAAYLGYSGEPFLNEDFERLSVQTEVRVGGYITDSVDFSKEAVYYACGPTPLMQAAAKAAERSGRPLYVSLERRMACGVGACFGCSIQTVNGNRRICRDGPVFDAREVFYG